MVTPALFGKKAGAKSRKTGMHRKKKGKKRQDRRRVITIANFASLSPCAMVVVPSVPSMPRPFNAWPARKAGPGDAGRMELTMEKTHLLYPTRNLYPGSRPSHLQFLKAERGDHSSM